jgi:hypothetical protein
MFNVDQDKDADERPDDYHRHLAAEIFAMLPYNRQEARRVLTYVDKMFDLEIQPTAIETLQKT